MLRLRLPLLATICLAGCSLNPKGELPGATNSNNADPSGFTGDDEGPIVEVTEPGVTPPPGNGSPATPEPSPVVAPSDAPTSPSMPTPVGEDPGPDDDAAGPGPIDGGPSDGGTEPFDGAIEPELPAEVGTVVDAGVPGDSGPETDANPP